MLTDYLKARYPLIWVRTQDERRVELAAIQWAKGTDSRPYAWSIASGLFQLGNGGDSLGNEDPSEVLGTIVREKYPSIYVLRDFAPFVSPGNPQNVPVIRALREVSRALRSAPSSEIRSVILVSPMVELPPELEGEIAVIDWPLPTVPELSAMAGKILADRSPELTDDERKDASIDAGQAAQGLTMRQAEDAYALSLVRSGTLSAPVIAGEKRRLVQASGAITWIDPDPSLEVGGLEILRNWLSVRRRALEPDARDFGLPVPKGVLVVGVPGCGKSLTAKLSASIWGLPLLRLDVGAVFGQYVGQSESQLRAALAVAESVSPCILWLDEIEKGFSGSSSSSETDGGITSRVLGGFLTWMQERKSSVFVFATANDVTSLPPELLRKGRFDEVFAVDLPDLEERRDIFSVHLENRGRSPESFNLGTLAKSSAGYSGAEIEAAIVDALFSAYCGAREIETADILASLQSASPLSQISPEKIDAVRQWARTRGARNASLVSTTSTEPRDSSRFQTIER